MESDKTIVKRRYSKYIFLDVVSFSNRSAEAQSEIVGYLNNIVRASLPLPLEEVERDCIFIPTGDGMCIAFVNLELPYDIHIQTALTILNLLEEYNQSIEDAARKFQIRIGINQNTDILVTDINNRTNVAGAGINLAARIMDKADAGQILVSQVVYEELQPSEKYMDKFRQFRATSKHGSRFQAFQFFGEGFAGLNTDIPVEFQKEAEEPEPKFDRDTALYLAMAIRHANEILELKGEIRHLDVKGTVVLHLLAKEVLQQQSTGKLEVYRPLWDGAMKTLREQLMSMGEVDFSILLELAYLISSSLKIYSTCFVQDGSFMYLIPTDSGKRKLEREYPELWKQLELGDHPDETNT